MPIHFVHEHSSQHVLYFFQHYYYGQFASFFIDLRKCVKNKLHFDLHNNNNFDRSITAIFILILLNELINFCNDQRIKSDNGNAKFNNLMKFSVLRLYCCTSIQSFWCTVTMRTASIISQILIDNYRFMSTRQQV